MGSLAADSNSLAKIPPSLCYNALPSQKPEPLGTRTPPLQAPGSVPFLWEEAPGKPRFADGAHRPKTAIARRLEPPPRMAFLSSSASAWQGAKVADADVASKAALQGPYYVLLRPSASLFDGPSVMARSNSLSSSSFRQYAVGDEETRKERSTGWFWRRLARRRDERPSVMKKGEAAVGNLPRSTSSKGFDGEGLSVEDRGVAAFGREEATAAANVKITRFRRSGSVPDISAASSYLWASIYGGLKHAVSAPWRSRKSASKR